MSDEDVKGLLSRAFGEEPPLGIDREEVLAAGRKRLRRKRVFEAGSVVALVVVAAAGAATLTTLADPGSDQLPPAASSTVYAPPGPELPLTTTPRPPSTATTHGPIPTKGPGAEQQLTGMLYATGVVNVRDTLPLPGHAGTPAFRQMGDSYVFEADLQRAKVSGYVQVVVDFARSGVVTCDGVPKPYGSCEIRMMAARQVSLSRYNDTNGERRVRAETVSAGGVRIVASASNITARDRDAHRPPPDTPPVLSDSELCTLVMKAGVGV